MAEEDEDKALLLHFSTEALGSPALIVNEEKARATPCKCYKVDEKLLCFSPGCIGTLRQEQIPTYCPTKTVETEGITKRVKLFREAIKEAKEEYWKLPPEKRVYGKWLETAGKHLRARGIEL